jgi:hypothetical protein
MKCSGMGHSYIQKSHHGCFSLYVSQLPHPSMVPTANPNHNSHTNPKISVYAQILSPTGDKVVVHENKMREQHGTFTDSKGGTLARPWTIATDTTYKSLRQGMAASQTQLNSPCHVAILHTSSSDRVSISAQQLVEALMKSIPIPLFAYFRDEQVSVLKHLLELFLLSVSGGDTPPRVSDVPPSS